MARSGINKVILVGNLGQDPEVKYTAGGAAVTTLSLATSESWKDKDTGSDQEKTEWHRVVLWRRLAEIAGEYLKKGSKVYIEGQLQTRKWEQDGQTRYTTEVVGRDMQFLDSRGSSSSDSSSYEDTNQDMSSQNLPDSGITDDDIPFYIFSNIRLALVPPNPKLLLKKLCNSVDTFSLTIGKASAPSSRFSIFAEPAMKPSSIIIKP